jgi:CDP-glucose 4,6-dehydratase
MGFKTGTMGNSKLSNFYSNKRLFITGHTGFKGTWLILLLKHWGAEVVGYALAPNQEQHVFHSSIIEKHPISSTIADITDYDTLHDAMKAANPDIVFHLAAQPLVLEGYNNPLGTYHTNVMGTINVLESCRNISSIKSVVIVTTDKCYLNRNSGTYLTELDRLGGDDPYSSSKAMAELATTAYRQSFMRSLGIGVATARGGNVIGGGDFSVHRLIPDIVKSIQKKKEVQIRHPQATRPWQFILDALWGYLILGQRLYENPKEYSEAFNFSPSEPHDTYTVQCIADYFISILGRGEVKIKPSNPHLKESTLLHLNSQKAMNKLHWTSKLSIKESLSWTAEWYNNYLMNYLTNKDAIVDITTDQLVAYGALLNRK